MDSMSRSEPSCPKLEVMITKAPHQTKQSERQILDESWYQVTKPSRNVLGVHIGMPRNG